MAIQGGGWGGVSHKGPTEAGLPQVEARAEFLLKDWIEGLESREGQ